MGIPVLFVQGAGATTYDEWDCKLVASLERELGPDYRVHYPRMPDEDHPDVAVWSDTLRREIDALGDGAMLVGHSVGATILLHMLASRPPRAKPGALFLLATPYIGEGGWPSDDVEPRTEFGLDGIPVFLYQGTADDTVSTAHVHLYARAIPHATVNLLDGRDHQLDNDLAAVARDIRALAT